MSIINLISIVTRPICALILDTWSTFCTACNFSSDGIFILWFCLLHFTPLCIFIYFFNVFTLEIERQFDDMHPLKQTGWEKKHKRRST